MIRNVNCNCNNNIKNVHCSDISKICEDIGKILGGNSIYQPWNIIGHCIPGLFILLIT